MNLHLTRDEADRLTADGRVVLFRPAVSYVHNRIGPDFGRWKHNPPAEFVEAAKPCESERPGGCGLGAPHERPRQECPDCLDGKRRVAVVVPCYCKPIREAGKSWPYGDCLVPEPCTDGFVTVATVVVTWGPLVVVDRGRPDGMPEGCLYLAGNYAERWDGQHWHIVGVLPPDVDPQSLVDKYAIGVKVVEP